jgi:hypothetical protein
MTLSVTTLASFDSETTDASGHQRVGEVHA